MKQPDQRRTDKVLTWRNVGPDALTRLSATMTDSDVARRAYELYLVRGGDHGHNLDDWLQAERELRDAARSTGNLKEFRSIFIRMSSAIWIAIVTGIVTVTAIPRFFRAKSTARSLDGGSVSNQWVAEHCVGLSLKTRDRRHAIATLFKA